MAARSHSAEPHQPSRRAQASPRRSASSCGAAGLTKAGAGTLNLTGANTYSGTTTISTGTLQIGNGGTTGTLGTGAVVNNAGVRINRSDAVTVGNVISGTGTRLPTQERNDDADGNEDLHAGLTTISAGTLQIGNGGTTGTLAPATSRQLALIVNRATRDLCRRDQRHRHADQAGAGTMTLTGANTYTGSTTISAGTLQIGSGGTDRARSAPARSSTTGR